MTTWQLLTSTWDWEPTVLVGCAALAAVYVRAARPLGRSQAAGLPGAQPGASQGASPGELPRPQAGAQPPWRARAVLFIAGVLVLLLALVSPLDTLGDTYLFSAHMLQHFLLTLVVPPLLLLGLPPDVARRLLRWKPADRAERVLGRPALAWIVGTGTLWVWHAPALYDAALGDEGIHVLQHLCFLVAWTIFWWPVIAPLAERRRLSFPGTLAYLIPASMANSLLGVILTFASPGLYPPYLHPAGSPAVLALVRQGWGLYPAVDQQVGGLVMWVGGMHIFAAACVGALIRWYREPEPDIVYDAVVVQPAAKAAWQGPGTEVPDSTTAERLQPPYSAMRL